MAEAPSRTVYRTCTWCEACCGIEVRVEGGAIADIRGDKLDPLSQGYICPKAYALKDLHEDPDRLRHPIKRTPTGWERIGWEEAFDYAARGLRRVQRAHGNDAAGIYLGNPSVHNIEALLFGQELIGALGTRNRFTASTLDQMPKQLVQHWMYGSGVFFSVPDVDRTDHMLILGANPLASNGSLMTAPDMRRRLERIRARGGRVVLVDPRRTETAKFADEHHFIRPGTDPLLVAAMLATLFAEGLVRPGRLASFTDGIEALGRLVAPFAPDAVAARVGMEAETIRRLAREFAAAPRAVAYGRIGTSTVAFGATATWLVECLNVVTGNLDREGGMMFPGPSSAVNAVALLPKSKRGRWRSRTRGTPEFMGELPAATLAEEITTPGDGQIRALATVAGNPVLSSPAGHQLAEALASLEFMVSVDFYLNETTRHAHVILPPVGPLEHDHFDLIFQVVAVRATARWSPRVFEAPEGTKGDAEILLELARRLRWDRGGRHRGKALAYRAMLAAGAERTVGLMLDYVLRSGPRGAGWRPGAKGLTRGRVRDSVHGIDLGPLAPCLPEKLPAKSKRIDLVPQELAEDLGRLRETLEGPVPELILIGRRHVRTNNSWSHNLPSLVKGPDRCTLLIHPADAGPRGVGDGDRVVVASRVGAVEVPAELDDGMMPGVVSLPHGYGHDVEGVRMKTAREHAGASINDLTDPAEIDPLSGNAVLSGTPVTVERADEGRAAAHG